jgi:pimeloyl-ACP methyl ester carboxylesterase
VVTNVAHLLDRSTRYLESPGAMGEEIVRGTRTLLFVHAFPLSADMWLPQMAKVPQGWRFIAPDLRGFRGAGPAFEDTALAGATVDDYADDLLSLIDHLDIDRVAIAGLSMGGYVAMALAARAPKRVTHLILADTRMTADTPEGRAGREKMQADLAQGGARAVADAMLPKLIGETTKTEQPDLADAVRLLIEANRPAAISGAIDAMKSRPDRTELLSRTAAPALVICGAEDAITPVADSEAMTQTLPNATLEVIPRAGHLSNLEQPAAFNAALQSFLSRFGNKIPS